MPPAHRHTAGDEAYFALSGVVEFHATREVFEGTRGSFVLVPAGESHTFGNTSDEPARLLALYSPRRHDHSSGLELPRAAAEPPDRDAHDTLIRRHGIDPD